MFNLIQDKVEINNTSSKRNLLKKEILISFLNLIIQSLLISNVSSTYGREIHYKNL